VNKLSDNNLPHMVKSNQYTEEYIKEAHKFSIFNIGWIKSSEVCGCFYCQTTFDPGKIIEWTDFGHDKGSTALCPNCGIDAVVGSNPNLPVRDSTFLAEMHSYWF
jgi:hypothetical protein